jgi:hypothetical protein
MYQTYLEQNQMKLALSSWLKKVNAQQLRSIMVFKKELLKFTAVKYDKIKLSLYVLTKVNNLSRR